MQLFLSTLNQMAVLALLMVVGFTVAKLKIVGAEASKILSKLENTVFIPALILYTFMTNFTAEKISSYGIILLVSLCLEIIVIPLAILLSHLSTKDGFLRKMYTYGLSFSNFGFMGNAVVLALFPTIFTEYVLFTIPLWTLIYVWGCPALLMDSDEAANGLKAKLKNLLNPMFVCVILGAIIGVTGLGGIIEQHTPFIMTAIGYGKDCMSPLAMILTGITFANMDFKKVLSTASIYVVTFIRLIAFPCVFGGIFLLLKSLIGFDVPSVYFICAMCTLSMPLGLNTVVVPAAYGKDTSVPAGMALVSHVLSVITIPLIFMLFGIQ